MLAVCTTLTTIEIDFVTKFIRNVFEREREGEHLFIQYILDVCFSITYC